MEGRDRINCRGGWEKEDEGSTKRGWVSWRVGGTETRRKEGRPRSRAVNGSSRRRGGVGERGRENDGGKQPRTWTSWTGMAEADCKKRPSRAWQSQLGSRLADNRSFQIPDKRRCDTTATTTLPFVAPLPLSNPIGPPATPLCSSDHRQQPRARDSRRWPSVHIRSLFLGPRAVF